jgi:hypothetical protein
MFFPLVDCSHAHLSVLISRIMVHHRWSFLAMGWAFSTARHSRDAAFWASRSVVSMRF